jgi:alkylation response protein AidB-like acyl-CoA dehydrogenase
MHFDYLEEHEMLRDASRGYLDRINPVGRYRRSSRDRRAEWREDAGQGWPAMLASSEYGGADATVVEVMVVGEELGRAAYGGAFIQSNLAALAISRAGDVALRGWLSPRLADGSVLVSCAQLNDRPDLPLAKANGETWAVTGVQTLVQDADIADFILTPAQTRSGLSLLLVPAAGCKVRAARTYDVGRALCDVRFEPSAQHGAILIGAEGDAGPLLEELLQVAATLIAIDSVGAAQRLLDMTVAYAKERTAFGKPIGAFQAVKHRCADMLIQLESARVSAWYAAVALRDGAADRAEAASMAKFSATEAAATIAGQALQLHGGIGFTWEHDLHIFLKRAKANEMLWGSCAWHRERVAAGLSV